MKNEVVVKKEKEFELDNQPQEQESRHLTIQDALINIVSRTDIDPERLEKFLELQIKMENRQAEKAFHAAMAMFQAECPIIQKTKKIDFASKGGGSVKYNYSPLDEIAHIIKPIMGKYGLSYSFDLRPSPVEGLSELLTNISHKDGFSRTFTYTFEDLHDDQRMNSSQRRKSAVTYAKRSNLENALGIVCADEDDDARRAVDVAISSAQIEELKKLQKSSGTTEKTFLDWLKVAKVEDLSAHAAKRAINALKVRAARGIS